MQLTIKHLDEITYEIIGAAIEIHRSLGPGLLESIYHKCMIYELTKRNIVHLSELIIPMQYKELEVEAVLRVDIFVANCIVVELKSVEKIDPVHKAQVLTYMRLLEAPKGIIINFNCENIFRQGQRTMVNEYFSRLPLQ